MTRKTSAKGREFIKLHEGNPLTAYLDPVNVPTIGVGFTNSSRVLTEMVGKLVPGKTKITAAQSDRIMVEMLSREYEPPVVDGMPGAKQHEFDCGVSVCWNLGPGSLGWRWANAFRAGNVKEAARILADNYNTAGGRKFPGLVRRRKEEALLLERGIYTGVDDSVVPEGVPREATPDKPATGDEVVREAQELLTARGFNPGAIDGWMGEKTRAALLAYQEAHPHLVNDGILGPATLSQLRRDAQAVGKVIKDTATKGGGAAAASGIAAFFSGLPWHIIVPVVIVGALAFFAWRYRDVIARRINSMRGKVVET